MATQNLDISVEGSAPEAAPDDIQDTHDNAVVVDTLNATLVPGIVLVSAATAFYFGANASSKK